MKCACGGRVVRGIVLHRGACPNAPLDPDEIDYEDMADAVAEARGEPRDFDPMGPDL
jgi:hypothetical protein